MKGIETTLKNINKVIKDTENKSLKALILCGIEIRRDMTLTAPKIPVDLRNLELSWYTTTVLETVSTPQFTGEDSGQLSSEHSATLAEAKGMVSTAPYPTMIMGFSANYAAFVHEMINANFARPIDGKTRRPGAGAKFFESALNRNQKKLLEIIKKNTQL